MKHTGLNVVQHERTRVSQGVVFPHLELLPKKTESLLYLKIVMPQGWLCGDVADCNTLLEQVTILHVHGHLELDSVVLTRELCQPAVHGVA